MFKVNNRNIRRRPGVFIVNFEYIWHAALEYFLLTLKMEIVDGILYCLNLNLSMHFIVGSRSPLMFQAKLYVTAIYLPAIAYFLSERAPS